MKRGSARVRVTCTGSGACRGTVKLIARVTEKRTARRHRGRQVLRRTRRVLVGKAGFSLAEGRSETLHVRLSARGKRLLREARGQGLRVRLVGSGIKARFVVLAAPKLRPARSR